MIKKKPRKQESEEKQLYGYFKRENDEISHEKKDIAKKGKLFERNWISSNSSTK